MNKTRMLVPLFLALLLVSIVHGFALANSNGEKVLVPDFALQTLESETIKLSDYRGRVVVLNFWASWCPPCRAEMPEFQELHEELEESGEAVLLLLNQVDGRMETVESGSKYLADNDLTMTNLLDRGTVGPQIFGIPGLPTTVVIDAEGYLSSYVVGQTTKQVVRQMIEGAK